MGEQNVSLGRLEGISRSNPQHENFIGGYWVFHAESDGKQPVIIILKSAFFLHTRKKLGKNNLFYLVK
jgi:hypothetical protein